MNKKADLVQRDIINPAITWIKKMYADELRATEKERKRLGSDFKFDNAWEYADFIVDDVPGLRDQALNAIGVSDQMFTDFYDEIINSNNFLECIYDALYGEVLLRGIIIPDHSTLADNVDNADPSEYDSFYV